MVKNEQLKKILTQCIEQVESNQINTIDELINRLSTELTNLTNVSVKS